MKIWASVVALTLVLIALVPVVSADQVFSASSEQVTVGTFGTGALNDTFTSNNEYREVNESADNSDNNAPSGATIVTGTYDAGSFPSCVATSDNNNCEYSSEDVTDYANHLDNVGDTAQDSTLPYEAVITYPATVLPDDLLIACLATGEGATSTTWPTGWTNFTGFSDQGGDVGLSCRWKNAIGTEDESPYNFEVPMNAGGKYAWIMWRFDTWDTADQPEGTGAQEGGSSQPNPPSHTFSWGTRNTLVLAVSAWDEDLALSSYPSGYGIGQRNVLTGSGSGAGIGGALKEVTGVSSENPGAFAIASDEQWYARTIAIPSVAAQGLDIEYHYTGLVSPDAFRTVFLECSSAILPIDFQVLTPPSTWNDRLVCNDTIERNAYQLTTAEWNSGDPETRFFFNSAGSVTLVIDYINIVTGDVPNINVQFNVTGVTDLRFGWTLNVEGQWDGFAQNFTVEVLTPPSTWDAVGNLDGDNDQTLSTALTSAQVVGGVVKMRFVEADVDLNLNQSSLEIDYISVESHQDVMTDAFNWLLLVLFFGGLVFGVWFLFRWKRGGGK